MERVVPYVKVGRSRTTIHIPSCLPSDSADTPLTSLFIEENKKSPKENQPKDRTPEKLQRPTGTSKRKLDLQFESFSNRKTPECQSEVFRKLQTYWEQKSAEKGTPVDNDKKVPTEISKSPSIVTPKKSSSCLVKEYIQLVTDTTSHQDNSDEDDSDIWVFTPNTPASCDQSDMGPPSSLPDVIRSTRKSRNRTPLSTPRSKSTGDVSDSDHEYSADDLTPKRPLTSKAHRRTRRLMSTNPCVYSQLISPSSSIDEGNSPELKRESHRETSHLSANVSDSWSDLNTSETANQNPKPNRKTSLDYVSIADISLIKPNDNSSIREFNDSTFIGDITLDLRSMTNSMDQSDLNSPQITGTPSLADDVKDLIHDIVCGFVNPDPLKDIDHDRNDEKSASSKCETEPLLDDPNEELTNATPDVVDTNNNDETSDFNIPCTAGISESTTIKSYPDGGDHVPRNPVNIEQQPSPDRFTSKFIFEEAILKKFESVNTLPLELNGCQSPDLSCNELSPLDTHTYANRNSNWSPKLSGAATDYSLGDIWNETDREPCVLKNRHNLKRPRQLQFQSSDQTSHDEYEPSPKHAKTPVSSEQFGFGTPDKRYMTTCQVMDYLQPYSPSNGLDTSYSSCDTCESLYLDISVSSESLDSDDCYCIEHPSIGNERDENTSYVNISTVDYSSPMIRSPYTRFSSPSYSTDEIGSPLVSSKSPYIGDWQSPAPNRTRLACSWSDSEDSLEPLDESCCSFHEDPLDLRTVNKDSPSDASPERVDKHSVTDSRETQPNQSANVRTVDHIADSQSYHRSNKSYCAVADPRVAVLQRDFSSYWTEYTTGNVTYTPTPSYEANQYALNCYTNVTSETSQWNPSENYQTGSETVASVMYKQPATTFILQDSIFNSTVTIPADQLLTHQPSSHPVITPTAPQQNRPGQLTVNEPVRTVLPSSNVQTAYASCYFPSVTTSNNLPIMTNTQFEDTNNSTCSDHQSAEKRNSGLFGMMAQSIKNKLANKVMKYIGTPTNPPETEKLELIDDLKNIRPYIISGYVSSTYLLSLVKKRDLLNDMFDDAIDATGTIQQWIIDSCRKNTAAIFARDLIFRVFTLGELNNFNMAKLNKKKMAAVRKCVKEQFPTMTPWAWRSKCIPLIKSSVSTLFKHRVKQVQVFFLMHSR